jgi:hypothetical protein
MATERVIVWFAVFNVVSMISAVAFDVAVLGRECFDMGSNNGKTWTLRLLACYWLYLTGANGCLHISVCVQERFARTTKLLIN